MRYDDIKQGEGLFRTFKRYAAEIPLASEPSRKLRNSLGGTLI